MNAKQVTRLRRRAKQIAIKRAIGIPQGMIPKIEDSAAHHFEKMKEKVLTIKKAKKYPWPKKQKLSKYQKRRIDGGSVNINLFKT